VILDGKALSKPLAAKGSALLAYLAVEKGFQRREKIAGLLWSDHRDAPARQNLSQALYALRRQTEPTGDEPPLFILTTQEVSLNPRADVWVDVAEFNHLLQAIEFHPHPQLLTCPACFVRLLQVAVLYRGSLLGDFSLKDVILFEEWVMVTREQLHRRAMLALHMLVECLEERGEIERALEYAWRQVELDPLGESGYRQVMRLLSACGRRSEALTQYSTLQHLLHDTLGVAPDGETRQVYEHILKQEPGSEIANDHPIRLPGVLTPLIGRRDELGQLNALLRDPTCRLVTIFGPGGVGKTRLALEVAHQLASVFPDGIYFISLSASQPGSPLWPSLAEVLRFPVREKQDPEKQLKDYLCDKRAMLFFDSFEAAMEKASWLSDLLQTAPQLTILVTSRTSLGISAEQVFTLNGMPVPGMDKLEIADQFDAVQLFLAFVRHRLPGFALDDHSRASVVRICQLVQGLPLGLLLASSWVELYSLDEIAEQIERSLDFLEASWSDVPERQHSLRATFDYSWNLLSEEEQHLFVALAAFQGGFTLTAIEPVTGVSTRLLRSLIDKSLVNRTTEGRYQIHDLVRQFAGQRLDEDSDRSRRIRARHSRYYLEALGWWEKGLKSAQQREALEAIDREAENLRAAWRWAVTSQDWQGIAVGLEGMCWYVDLRLRFVEGERACRTALDQISGLLHSSLTSALTVWQAHFLRRFGQPEKACNLLQAEKIRLVEMHASGRDVRTELAQVWYELGEYHLQVDREVAKQNYHESLVLFDELDDLRGQALVLVSLGEAMHHTGPLDQAQCILERGVNLCRGLGDPRLLARSLLWAGWNCIRQGNLPEGETLIRESIDINRTIGDRFAEAFWGAELGRVHAWTGHFLNALQLLSKSIDIYQELNLKQEATFIQLVKALVEVNLLAYKQARHDFQDCISDSTKLNYQRGIGVGIFGLGCISLEEGEPQKAEELFLKAIPILQSAQTDETGWCLALLVISMQRTGQTLRGWEYARQGLELAQQAHVYQTAAMVLIGIALLLIDEGQVERAIELDEVTQRFPLIEKSPWYNGLLRRLLDQLVCNVTSETVRAARERGRQRDLFATVQELLQEINDRLGSYNAGQTPH
jgi:predicted ATPase/DNA-binding SARP family transcriptional activator